jgi:spermidine dehydrogenase
MASEIDPEEQRDRELGMGRPISRRDFLNGVAIGIGGAVTQGFFPWSSDPTLAAPFAQEMPGYYPPALTGMRGSHDGSFDVAHALRDGTFWKQAGQPTPTRETYDLVVVGGGISGLAAAYFYRARANGSARILVLDNHDDFGGHAKRNEFHAGGQLWIANGGTAGIESPFPYSEQARALMTELGIDPVELSASVSKRADRSAFRGLQSAYFFDKETFGEDRLVVGVPEGRRGAAGTDSPWTAFLARTPFSADVQRDIARLQEQPVDYMPGLSSAEKKDRLSRMSYKDFLLNLVKVRPEAVWFYQARTHGLYGIGIDAVGALECWAYGYPGFEGMKLDRDASGRMSFTARGDAAGHEPYNFHHPDGGASVARHLVRALLPDVLPGETAEDLVTARADYSRLDRSDSPVRIRLGSTVVRARHIGQPSSAKEVEVSYVREDKIYSVQARGVVMACWNMVIPSLVPELPERQQEALRYGVKVPLVYTTVAVNDWQAFKRLGISRVSSPGMYHSNVRLEQPTVMGTYDPPVSPDKPILLRMLRTPCLPGQPARMQHRAGHMNLLTTPFSIFERHIRDQLARTLGSAGFDPARDINAITVNRWPHGYAYEYNPLWDPDWAQGEAPCEIGRRRFGRIAIANSDAAAAAYIDQAMDQAYRAVEELFGS